jgi:hypothetical protein
MKLDKEVLSQITKELPKRVVGPVSSGLNVVLEPMRHATSRFTLDVYSPSSTQIS